VSVSPRSFLFTLDVGEGFGEPEPGQFVLASARPDLALRRPFAVAGAPRPGTIELLIELRGPGTHAMAALPEGSRIPVLGPSGNTLTMAREGETAILVAGGIGLAGLRLLAARLLDAARRTVILVGARRREDLMHHLLPPSQGGGRVRVELSTDDGSEGLRGTAADLLRREVARPAGPSRISACGPPGMLREVAAIAASGGLRCEVIMEEIMACGVGACRGCVVRTKTGYRTACSDGPVFDASEIVFDEGADA
jgi:dihydroorotate dehydrogenase electron transfer subunit